MGATPETDAEPRTDSNGGAGAGPGVFGGGFAIEEPGNADFGSETVAAAGTEKRPGSAGAGSAFGLGFPALVGEVDTFGGVVEISDGGVSSVGVGAGDEPSGGYSEAGRSDRSMSDVASLDGRTDGGGPTAGPCSGAVCDAIVGSSEPSTSMDFFRRAGSGVVTDPLDRRGLALWAHRSGLTTFGEIGLASQIDMRVPQAGCVRDRR